MTSNEDTVVLIDLSSIAYPIYLTSQANPDANYASQQIVARVVALTQGFPHAAVCCDSGRSFRHEISTVYKANRPERNEPLHHQIRLAVEQLEAEGYPIWTAKGFEADDIIATACARTMAIPEARALIVSGDKDLLQLVSERVQAKSVRDGSIVDAAAVVAKFGVRPDQMRDYLTLVGDAADNIKGAPGIGEKIAAKLLAKFDTLDAVYVALREHGTEFTPGLATALRDLEPRLGTVRALVTLRTDVEIAFEEISADRAPKDSGFVMPEEEPMAEELTGEQAGEALGAFVAEKLDAVGQAPAAAPETQALVPQARVAELAPPPGEWERQLDPRSMSQAMALSDNMHKSRMFASAYGTAQAVLSTIMLGRELGLPAMASLRSVHVIEGKHSLSASLMVALVLKSGMAEYFEPISFTDNEATYETHRKGARNPVRLTHTIEMAITAWPKGKKDWQQAFEASGWGRNPTDMLVARATSRLARMVYPDLLAGLYTPEELMEIRAEKEAA